MRSLEYERLKQIKFSGNLLDVGGGEGAHYRNLIDCGYESINIDQKIKPTWLVEEGEVFPCPANNYDNALALNTLEHVYDSRFILENIHRSLKPGGRLICTIPFMHRVHGHPDDYFRGTESWWRRTLKETGFENVHIDSIFWGPFSMAVHCVGLVGPFKRLRRHAALLLDILYAKLNPRGFAANAKAIPMGYFIEARK